MSARRSLQAYALLGAVLVLGIVSGSGATYAYVRYQTGLAAAPNPGRMRRERMAAFTRELDLSAEQQAKVEAIFQANNDERDRRTRAMFEACGEPVREHKRRVDAEIRAVLRPEQQARFDELAQEQERRFFQPGGGKPHEDR